MNFKVSMQFIPLLDIYFIVNIGNNFTLRKEIVFFLELYHSSAKFLLTLSYLQGVTGFPPKELAINLKISSLWSLECTSNSFRKIANK
jgi:hypothetical protein